MSTPRAFASSNQQKYETGNPVVRYLLARFLDNVVRHVSDACPSSVLDLGCGEGFVAERVTADHPDVAYRGYDVDPGAVEQARQRCAVGQFEHGDVTALALEPKCAELAICLEVLEHLPEPAASAEHIARWAKCMAIISVPWEPFFRLGNFLRGKHIARLGNTPEHLQQFNRRSLKALLSPHFDSVQVHASFPWIIAVCRHARSGA